MIALPLLLALAGAPVPEDPVVARVDSVQITRADVDERLRAVRSARSRQRPADAVADLVDEALLAAEGRRLGLDRDPAVVAAVDVERRRLAADAFVSRMSGDPTDAQLREMYHLTADTARLVLVKLATEPEARALLDRLRKGADIAAEAKASVDPVLAKSGGDTGLVYRAALDPALAAEVFRAKPGAIVGPVQLGLGWAVARVVERQVADEAAFAARRASILSFAREQGRGQARSLIVEQLKSKGGVKLDEAFLKSVGQSGPVSEKELDHVIATVDGQPIRYRAVHPGMARFLGARGHGGAAARVSFARSEIDRIVLERSALAQGVDRTPAVAARLPAIERYLVADAAAARIAGKPGADRRDPKVRQRLEALRAAATVHVEQRVVAKMEDQPR